MAKQMPVMHVVAGPPGGGKSSTFPVKESGLDYFDADARAAELNGGSYHAIPQTLRKIVNREFEQFIEQHIASRKSFTFETTLRSAITFDQAQRARGNGFFLKMRYIGLNSLALHLERIAARADRGGHSAPPATIKQIHASSMINSDGH
jgi:predicted ABC-type ATPase